MKKILLLIVLILVFGVTAQAAKIVHLDATRPASIVIRDSGPDPTDPNYPNSPDIDFVGDWLDVSGTGTDIIVSAADDYISYPSSEIGSGGLAGVRFTGEGTQGQRMLILFSAASDALLDFTGPATGGFSMFLAAKDDIEHGHDVLTDILGNSSAQRQQVSMRYKEGGNITAFVTGINITRNGIIGDGDTFVHGMNYNATTGEFTVSSMDNNDALQTDTVTAVTGVDFSNPAHLTLGYTTRSERYLDGFVGEVVIYDDVLSTADFNYQFEVLARKWIENRAVEPVEGAAIALAATVQLEWKNILPDTKDADVYVDVWFGASPGSMSLEVDGGTNTTTTSVSIPAEGKYYWAIDTYLDGDPNEVDYDGNPMLHVVEGPVYAFFAVPDPNPKSVSSPDWTTWPDEDVDIGATVEDVGDSDVTVTFTCEDDPNLVSFSPNPVVIAGGGGIAATTATIDYAYNDSYGSGDIEVTMTAKDELDIGLRATSTMMLNVYNDGCQAYRQNLAGAFENPEYPEDIAVDCKLDLADFAEIAADWLYDYAIQVPTPIP